VLEFLAGLSLDIPVSIMSQYNPAFYEGTIPEMRRTLERGEYEAVLERACDMGFTTIYGQDMEAVETYVPDFDSEIPFGDQVKIL